MTPEDIANGRAFLRSANVALEARKSGKKWREIVVEARIEVEEAQDSLGHVPRTYGGHRSGEGTSVTEGIMESKEHYLHTDGRVMRLIKVLDDMAWVMSDRGRAIVVSPWHLSEV